MEYTELLKECDRILNLMSGKSATQQSDIYAVHTFRDSTHPAWANTVHALNKLIEDDRILDSKNGYYQLTGNSPDFIANGGYEKFVVTQTEKENEERYKENLRVKTDKAVIKTNKVFRKYYTQQYYFFWAILFASVVSAFSSFMAWRVANRQYKENIELKGKDSLIQSLKNRLSQKENNALKDSIFYVLTGSTKDGLPILKKDTIKVFINQ